MSCSAHHGGLSSTGFSSPFFHMKDSWARVTLDLDLTFQFHNKIYLNRYEAAILAVFLGWGHGLVVVPWPSMHEALDSQKHVLPNNNRSSRSWRLSGVSLLFIMSPPDFVASNSNDRLSSSHFCGPLGCLWLGVGLSCGLGSLAQHLLSTWSLWCLHVGYSGLPHSKGASGSGLLSQGLKASQREYSRG